MSDYNEEKARQELAQIESMQIDDKYKAELRKGFFQRLQEFGVQESTVTSPATSNVIQFPENVQPTKQPLWFKSYLGRFIPIFRHVALEDRRYSLKCGDIQGIRLRKLLTGDFMFLAALCPAYLTYLKDDQALFDPITNEPLIFPATIAIVSRALSEWDFEKHAPTGFALSVLQTIVTLWEIKDDNGEVIRQAPFSVNDLLQSDPEEVLTLVSALYQYNTLFFKKLYSSSGIIQDIFSILGGSLTLLTSGIKQIAAQSIQMVQELTQKTKESEDKNGSGGQPSGGTTNSLPSSSPPEDTLLAQAS